MSYISGGLHRLPQYILPLLIISVLDSETTAYFRIAWAISSILFLAIPIAVCSSLFAEGSYNRDKLRENVIRAASLLLALVITGIGIIFLFGDRILLLFGTSYSESGLRALKILVLSSVPTMFTQLYVTVKMVQMRMKWVVFVRILTAVLVLGIAFALTSHLGLVGASVSWTVGQTIAALVIALTLLGKRYNLRCNSVLSKGSLTT